MPLQLPSVAAPSNVRPRAALRLTAHHANYVFETARAFAKMEKLWKIHFPQCKRTHPALRGNLGR